MKELFEKLKVALLSALITIFLMPFYGDLISVSIVVENEVFEIGYLVSYLMVTLFVFILLRLLFYFRLKEQKRNRTEERNKIYKKTNMELVKKK